MLAALAEAVIFVGIIVPGALIVIAGGLLVRAGTIDFFDLAWFVAAGSILGADISYRLGRAGASGLGGRSQVRSGPYVTRAKDMLTRYGGFGMVVARFLGPVSAFVPFASAMADMPHRKFTFWNVVSAVPYALILPAIGYFLGDILAWLGPQAGRVILVVTIALIIFGALVFFTNRIRRNVPMLFAVATRGRDIIVQSTSVQNFAHRWPRMANFASGRFDPSHVTGLTLTFLAVVFVYVFGAYLDSVVDFVSSDTITAVDQRVAALLLALREPHLIQVFTYITALGDATVIGLLLVGFCITFALNRQWPAILGLSVAVAGNVLTVALLKSFFARPRPEYAYFVETSGSFPSGHAAISVAFYATLAFLLWRTRFIGPLAALIGALFMVFAISLSRIYLVEHYMSDVLNGALVGSLWLLIAIAVFEWMQSLRFYKAPVMTPRAFVVLITLAAAGYFVFNYNQAQTVMTADQVIQVATIDEIPPQITMTTKSLLGTNESPVAFIIAAQSSQSLVDQLSAAGWALQPRPGLASALRTAFETGEGSDEVLLANASVFWNARPVDIVMVKSTAGNSPQDLILRIWQTNFLLSGASPVFVTTVQMPTTGSVDAALAFAPLGFSITDSQTSLPTILKLSK